LPTPNGRKRAFARVDLKDYVPAPMKLTGDGLPQEPVPFDNQHLKAGAGGCAGVQGSGLTRRHGDAQGCAEQGNTIDIPLQG